MIYFQFLPDYYTIPLDWYRTIAADLLTTARLELDSFLIHAQSPSIVRNAKDVYMQQVEVWEMCVIELVRRCGEPKSRGKSLLPGYRGTGNANEEPTTSKAGKTATSGQCSAPNKLLIILLQ